MLEEIQSKIRSIPFYNKSVQTPLDFNNAGSYQNPNDPDKTKVDEVSSGD